MLVATFKRTLVNCRETDRSETQTSSRDSGERVVGVAHRRRPMSREGVPSGPAHTVSEGGTAHAYTACDPEVLLKGAGRPSDARSGETQTPRLSAVSGRPCWLASAGETVHMASVLSYESLVHAVAGAVVRKGVCMAGRGAAWRERGRRLWLPSGPSGSRSALAHPPRGAPHPQAPSHPGTLGLAWAPWRSGRIASASVVA